MKDLVVIFNYPESDWGPDLACFHLVGEDIDGNKLIDAINNARATINYEEYPHGCFVTDAICDIVAKQLRVTWDYMAVAGTYHIQEAQ